MTQKIVVLGSNSFSGANFIDYILERRMEVIGISRSPEPHPIFLPYKKRMKSNFKFYQLDLNHHLQDILTIINDFQPDYVVNFAAQSMVGESWKYPEHWFQTNVIATIKLHDKLRHSNYLKKYIHISTPEVYGPCEGLVKENTNYNPSTPYAVSRAATDMSLMSFYKAYSFPVVFTRAANIYGPGQQLYRIIPRTILFFLIGKKLQLHGGGQSIRSFIHIKDVVDGTLRVALQGLPGEIYHFSTSTNISIRSLVELIAHQMNVSFDDNVNIVEEQLGKDAAYLLDSTKARESLDWKAKVSLEHGIDETIAWIKSNFDEIKKLPFDYIHKP
jgi:dTDP-glucose 4,6-dehydratase